jgi:hypothetical protein
LEEFINKNINIKVLKMIKLNWKYRILTGVLTGFLFIGLMSLMDYLLDGNLQSIKSYLFQGIFFGIFMGIGLPYVSEKFGNKLTSKLGKKINPKLTQFENIELEASANLFNGIEAVSGKLFLTNKKLIFNSHKINIQKGQTNIEYDNMSEISKRKTANLIDNGLRIKDLNGKQYDFVINSREEWIKKLNEKIAEIRL